MMPLQSLAAADPTPGGYLLVLAIVLPAVAIIALFALGGRMGPRAAALMLAVQIVIALRVLFLVWETGQPLVYVVGGWTPPLGIALRADGISAIMMLTSAIIAAAAAHLRLARLRPAP